MKTGCRMAWGVLAGGLLATCVLAQPDGSPSAFEPRDLTLAQFRALGGGGYVLYMRHGNTDNSRPDALRVDLADCATQRPLNAEGRKVAAQVGTYLRQSGIPVHEVLHSPLCRARESAELAFGHLGDKVRADAQLMYPGNLTSEEKKPIVARTRELLSAPVPAGTNRVLVAHAPNLADVMGYYVKPEATVVVIRPMGGGRFDYIGSIQPAQWPRLLTGPGAAGRRSGPP